MITILTTIFLTGYLLGGCTTRNVEYPTYEQIQKDTKEYIVDYIDPDASIKELAVIKEEDRENEYTVSCIVDYLSDIYIYKDEFELLYSYSGGIWELDKCSINIEYDDKTKNWIMSQEITDFTFQLGEKVYRLPFPYKMFIAEGWKLSSLYQEKDSDTLEPKQFMQVHMERNGEYIGVIVANMNDDSLPISECNIAGITVEEYSMNSNTLNFVIAGGITGTSTPEMILQTFGIPSEQTQREDVYYITYQFGDEKERSILDFEVHYDQEKKEVIRSKIELRNLEGLEYQLPKTTFNYTAPSSMGEEYNQGILKIEGKLNQLPCPLAEFFDDEWELLTPVSGGQSKYSVVNAKNAISWNLEKDNKEIVIWLRNYNDCAVFAKDCYLVDCVYMEYFEDDEDNPLIELPGGLNTYSSAEEIIKVWSTLEENPDNNMKIQYLWQQSGENFVTDITVSDMQSEIRFYIGGYRSLSVKRQ